MRRTDPFDKMLRRYEILSETHLVKVGQFKKSDASYTFLFLDARRMSREKQS